MRQKMIDKPNSNYQYCEIRLKGHLENRWVNWFDGLDITLEENGNTLLSGYLVDQAALHGLLKKVRDIGLPLLSVKNVEPNNEEVNET
jgi:hypothetical protein